MGCNCMNVEVMDRCMHFHILTTMHGQNRIKYYDYYYAASGSSLKSLDMISPSLTSRQKRGRRTNLCLVSLSEVTLTPGQDELSL